MGHHRLLLFSLATTMAAVAASCGQSGTDQSAAGAQPTVTQPAPTQPKAAEPDALAAAPPGSAADETDAELYPDVVAATAKPAADGSWTFDATVSSPYDSPDRYADAWRILAPDGTELGVRILTHDHAGEQPFTRSLGNVEIPADITVVTIQGRDQLSGWGGETVDVVLER